MAQPVPSLSVFAVVRGVVSASHPTEGPGPDYRPPFAGGRIVSVSNDIPKGEVLVEIGIAEPQADGSYRIELPEQLSARTLILRPREYEE
jgi:hypothetical protein